MQELAAASGGCALPSLDFEASAGRREYGAAFLVPIKLPPFSSIPSGSAVSYAFDLAGGVRRTVEQQYALALYQQREVEAAALSVSAMSRCSAGGRIGARANREPRGAAAGRQKI